MNTSTMSYNYDLNPWDDTPANAQGTGQSNQGGAQYQSNTGGGGYNVGGGDAYSSAAGAASGYSNPTAQYVAQDAWADDQYNSNYTSGQQQHIDEQPQQYDQQYDQSQQMPPQPPNPPGCISRFLRAHVPLCGTCMDITSPLLDVLLKYVNRDLLASKVFYFFFYSAFGSLFPLMGVYFKQLGMNPAQVGILTGVRPIIEIFSAPFWNSLAERFKKSKLILLFSLLSWIVFTYSLAHIRPPASACVAFNDTDYVLYTPYSANDLSNYDVGGLEAEGPAGSGSGLAESSEVGSGTKENEVFMNKMPQQKQQQQSSMENKDEILINEENVVNDQGKRRRRRKRSYNNDDDDDDDVGLPTAFQPQRPYEQIPRPSRAASSRGGKQYNYATAMNSRYQDRDGDDEGYASSQLVDLDLENDFDDLAVRARSKRSPRAAYERGEGEGESEGETSDSSEHEESDSPEESERRSRLRVANSHESDQMESGSEGAAPAESDEQAEEENEVNGAERQITKTYGKHNMSSGESSGSPKAELAGPNNDSQQPSAGANKTKRIYKQRHKTPPTHIVGMSPITVEYAVNYNREKHSQFVTPMFSTIVYKLDDIKEVFFLLLLLISLGEFFSAPAITIADSNTLSCLGVNTALYGRQRMFGSIGWAITLMLVGMALDNSKTIHDHPCGPHQRERSYHVCFTIFSLLMGCAFMTATQFKFNYSSTTPATRPGEAGANQDLVTKTVDDSTVVTTTIDATNSATNIDDVYASTRPREIFNTAPPVNAPPPSGGQKFEFLDKWKSAVFAQSTWEPPEWIGVFRQFKNTMHLTYLFITWFLGCGVGLVFTFLFWHLQDVGGTPTLFGICSVINHISEILAYFFSSFFIKRYGHTKVLSVGLGCNVIRFLYVAFLSNPYYALPFELVQGITHAACFAACCSYMSHVSKPELKASTQGVMQGLHNGIGRACGALLGGYMINAIGSRASFCIYGLLSGCVLGGFLYVRERASDDGDVKVIDDENLGNIGAPQGVPEKVRF